MSLQPVLSEEERTRAEKVEAYAALGAEGVPPLMAWLTDPSWVVRRRVVAALASMGVVAAEALERSLTTERDDETRIAAAVDALVASSAEVHPALERMARHENPAVAADAAQILGRRRDPDSIPLLVELMRHADDNVSVAAVEALGRVGGRAAVSGLLEAVESGNFFRVFPAVDVLGRSGDPRAVPALTQLLEASHYQLEAARALGRTGEKGAVEPLALLLGKPTDGVV